MGSDFTITAANGQEDNLSIKGSDNKINTGDGDDIVNLNNMSFGMNNIVDGGDGNDMVLNTGNNTVTNFENVGEITLTENQSQQIQIGDKTYTFTNPSASSKTVSWEIQPDGQIRINASWVEITAADGQNDNVYISGRDNIVRLGDGDDNVEMDYYSQNNVVDGGTGHNTIINFITPANSNYIINFDGHPTGIYLKKDETQEIQIGDKTYTVKKLYDSLHPLSWTVDENGQITFEGEDYEITAASGQNDNIVVNGRFITLNTGDGDDNIVVNNTRVTLNTGDGNDTVTLNSGIRYAKVDGGAGNDTLIDNSNDSTNTITNFELPLSGANGSYEFGTGESQQIQIGDKSYTVTNKASYSNTLTWSTDENGQITFDGGHFSITAASGQEDNIIVNGYHITLNTSDQNDTVVLANGSHNNNINTGTGNDTVTIENNAFDNTIDGGTGTNTVTDSSNSSNTIINATNYPNGITLNNNETQQIQIGDKYYTVTNKSSYSKTLTWSIDDNGQITFNGDFFTITAADNQEDNIIVKGSWNTVNTGDLNDTVILANGSHNNNINTGTGNDTVTIENNTFDNTIDAVVLEKILLSTTVDTQTL